eukprot:TRINITY_DN41733_c0_g1_i1.p1 TRINITY_DN41733_c0_g1~~TRINITY_DN41733_c0_g1_i1.p1  ORF type:complete len:622 (+),score=123.16 TRINITY_DN41733_c0_g1_i1:95-1960(+)
MGCGSSAPASSSRPNDPASTRSLTVQAHSEDLSARNQNGSWADRGVSALATDTATAPSPLLNDPDTNDATQPSAMTADELWQHAGQDDGVMVQKYTSERRKGKTDIKGFLKQEENTTAMDREKELRRRGFFMRLSVEDTFGQAVDPSEAMKELLQHVHLDPDGGILNLDSVEEEDQGASGHHDLKVSEIKQTSKIWALRKSGPELVMAATQTCRSLLNPGACVVFSVSFLHSMYFEEDYPAQLAEHSQLLGLDGDMLGGLFTFTAVMELFGMVALLLQASMSLFRAARAKYGLCYGLWWTQSDATEVVVEPHYRHLAKFWWSDLPMLQGFSALRTIAFVHPNLIGRNFKEFDVSNDLSCRALERILHLDKDRFHEGFLVQGAMRLIHLDKKDEPDDSPKCMNDADIDKALGHTPTQALRLLEDWADKMKNQDKGRLRTIVGQEDLKLEALQKAWRVRAMMKLNTLCFMSSAVVFFLMGFAAFYSKTCTLFFALATGHSVWYSFLYLVSFLHQIVSIVKLDGLMRWRVTVLIFGGTDAVISPEERYVMDTYLAVLMGKIWQSREISCFEKIAVMLMFDDDDVQQLVIEEEESSKAAVILAVKKYMTAHGAPTWASKAADWIL